FSKLDDSVLSETGIRISSLRIERDELVTDRHIKNAFVCTIGPIGNTVARPAARTAPVAFIFLMLPQKGARGCVKGNHTSLRARGKKQASLREKRRALVDEFGAASYGFGLETPGNFQLVKIRCINLIERHVARTGGIVCVMVPLAVGDPGRT